jgi:feruloyl-CoA synthase
MDAELRPSNAPFRDTLYAPRRLDVVERPGGEFILTNPTPFSEDHQTTTASLAHWAIIAPDRLWLAERSGSGWRTLSFAEAWQLITALAAGLRGLGVVSDRPLLILARNTIDHALIAYAAMSQGMPVAPVSSSRRIQA